ncbi:uncharacterized protein LOC112601834 [Melanaphis sacchari]|uniref:uncharacterized protein LOC112601834 n=1 Tax=Melanaphis sacchari TaxID=742174 RepID=UPI000DC13B5F|nr:uncharacterized protein LOC112601834 [Melanaphis sacchari]
MISKRILISAIFIIFLVQFITCPTTTELTDLASPETKPKAKYASTSKSGASKAEITTTDPTDLEIDQDDETMKKSNKSNGPYKYLSKFIQSICWPLRYFWGKLKNLCTTN